MATQPTPDLSWKQEVNLRLAAHKSRRDPAAGNKSTPAESPQGAADRAAQAAARVAARYAQAPSYSQMLAEEARAAVRAAEAASQAAYNLQAAAESVLAGLETAGLETAAYAEHEQQPVLQPILQPSIQPSQQPAPRQDSGTFFDTFLGLERPFEQPEPAPSLPEWKVRWEQELPTRTAAPPKQRNSRRAEQFAFDLEDWREPASTYGEPETVEPAQPIHANLIEFPREIIAPRKARPRIAEGPLAPEGGERGQLSIFEVDPGVISIEPAPAGTALEPAAPGWSRIRLEAESLPEPAAHVAATQRAHSIQLAPLGMRVMSAMVDTAWIGAIFTAAALLISMNFDSQPSMKLMEFVGIAAFIVLAVLYKGFFFMFAGTTPGMRYAGISLCTFDDQRPTREQMRRRIAAVLLSLLPVGLGLLWAIFDDDHLSWHDRISRTYQRCA